MTRIQQVLWKLEMDYIGHPYYVSGNAIVHALGRSLDLSVLNSLRASHGVFVPGEFGRFPEEHSCSGVQPYLGSRLPDIQGYDDLFLHREPDHHWLLASRPREAVNTHGVRTDAGHPTLAHRTIMGRPKAHRKGKKTIYWYVHAYLHADDPTTLPLGEASLSNIQFGGKRNYGYGEATLKDTRLVDLDTLDYSRLRAADAHLIRLITPFVTASEYPGANDVPVPRWWAENRDDLRFREERVVVSSERYRLETVDHGQVMRYLGDRPIETARNGLTRVGSHSRLGFGEFRVIPVLDCTETTGDRNGREH